MSDTYLGLYRGIVEEGVDPAAHGRLRVSVPSVLGGDPRWAERSVDQPGAAAALPPGTTVWVQFEGGNTERPVVVGCVPAPTRVRPNRPANAWPSAGHDAMKERDLRSG